jgi:YHS domain-containing protein
MYERGHFGFCEALMAKDPVCGMDVNERDAVYSSEWRGETYYFCSPQCKGKFEREPREYTGEPPSERKVS